MGTHAIRTGPLAKAARPRAGRGPNSCAGGSISTLQRSTSAQTVYTDDRGHLLIKAGATRFRGSTWLSEPLKVANFGNPFVQFTKIANLRLRIIHKCFDLCVIEMIEFEDGN